ncbi:putative ferredoxin [Desulforapulum autotrophicum HRM2]|uniref:Ferredoxin n=1 Tax=Desulforapulum autotrophicum (strain ATCC 43914 / DSM 3382 / VKM B-1955 / HRM2) TaxID=177437 RepID=C0QE18_DESAH|nr:4Fe-4S binding protein [Desulforapulum autotrophicum]ACN17439.1 putative ferredoxin [Desulforapulum autotrophicum HRM2]
MPWINKELCTGCQTCIDECSVEAISMEEDIAFIDEDECIRCGVCHDVCPENAVRHDGERIPEEVQSNLIWAKKLLTHEYYSNDKTKQKQLIERLQRFFTKNKKVTEQTIEQLKILQNTEYAD